MVHLQTTAGLMHLSSCLTSVDNTPRKDAETFCLTQPFKLLFTCVLRVARPDHGPEEELEGGLVGVEVRGPVRGVDVVDVDDADGEGEVHDDEDEQEDEHVQDHVRDADDDGAGGAPHQAALHGSAEMNVVLIKRTI